MHMTIGLITYAKTKQDAIDQAQNVLEGLTGDGAGDFVVVTLKFVGWLMMLLMRLARAGCRLVARSWVGAPALAR